MGAAWLAAKHVAFDLPRDDTAFCQVFYTYTPTKIEVNGKIADVNGKTEDLNGKTVDSDVNGQKQSGVNGKTENGVNESNGSCNGNGLKMNDLEIALETCGCDNWSSWS